VTRNVALSLGRGVARDGAFTSRRGSGEGFLSGRKDVRGTGAAFSGILKEGSIQTKGGHKGRPYDEVTL